ncbi:MAG: peptide deformylase [Acidobacteriaceae bacterium]
MNKILKIITAPDPILYKKTKPVKDIDQGLRQLAANMIETCRLLKGIGIAAPQVGHSIRMCTIELEDLGIPPFALINPKITKRSWKKIEMEEGCLSVPGVFGMVKRPISVKVTALNLEGNKVTINADGILARVLQHEIDHLDGILFTSKTLKQTAGPKLEKM